MICFLRISILVLFLAFQCTLPAAEIPELSAEQWETVSNYLLPDDHPAKTLLDDLFNDHTRVIKNKKSLKEAGFRLFRERRQRRPYILRHPSLPGYVFKFYTDEQPVAREWESLGKRIEGARLIQEMIDRYGYDKFFKVPKKWLYNIPLNPEYHFPAKAYPKKFLMIAEDMDILPYSVNRATWGSACVTPELLSGLYHLISELGLSDSLFISNIPFSKDNKIAFVDTEKFHQWPIEYRRMLMHLSPSMQSYWKLLTE